MAKRPYYTLVIKTGGVWSPEFGSYDRGEVEFEMETESYLKKNMKILKTSEARQSAVDAAIAHLNGKI